MPDGKVTDSEIKMAYLIDTDILIYSLKDNQLVQKHFRENANLPKFISVITHAELVYGARKSKHVEKNLAVVSRLAEIFPILDVSVSVAETFGNIKSNLVARGVAISDMDLLIGATALVYNLTIVTNNEKHFKRIPGLNIENWTR